jgi:hypothetical protein
MAYGSSHQDPRATILCDKYGWTQDTFDSIDWETQYKTLVSRLERCYQYQDQLTVNDPRNKIFYKTIEEMQNEDPRLIQSWLRICERIIRVHKKEINKPNKTKTMMEQYLQWRPSQQANKRNKKARTRHHKQDLRPD